jgi:hypothetical protein
MLNATAYFYVFLFCLDRQGSLFVLAGIKFLMLYPIHLKEKTVRGHQAKDIC